MPPGLEPDRRTSPPPVLPLSECFPSTEYYQGQKIKWNQKESVSRSVSQLVGQSVGQSVANWSVGQSVHRSVSRSDGQSVDWMVRQLFCYWPVSVSAWIRYFCIDEIVWVPIRTNLPKLRQSTARMVIGGQYHSSSGRSTSVCNTITLQS